MKQYLYCIFLVLGITSSAQPTSTTNEDVSEFLPYQIMSFLTTTLDNNEFSETNTTTHTGELIPYRIGQLWGYCDVKKNIKIPVQYEYASLFHANVAYVKKGTDYFFINKKGEELSSINWIASDNDFTYAKVTSGVQDQHYFLAQKNEKEIQTSTIRINSKATNGLLKVFNKADRAGVVDVYGKPIVPIRYDDISFEGEDMIITILDRKCGVYTKEGKEVSIPKYTWIGTFENGIAKVKTARKFGYINTLGQEVIPIQYTSVYRRDGYIYATDKTGQKGVLTLQGKIIIPFQYKYISSLNTRFFTATNAEGKKGIIDHNNKTIQPFIYRFISSASDEGDIIIAEGKNGEQYLNGKTGNKLTKTLYKDAGKFGDRPLARVVNENNKKGFIGRNGKEVIPPKWYSADWFKNGYAEVRVSSDASTKGLINTKGQLVVDTIYSDITVFEKANRIAVRNWKLHDGKWAFIDFKGNKLSGFEYDRVIQKENGYAIVEKNDLEGLLDPLGKEVLSCSYKDVDIVNDTYMIIRDTTHNYGTYTLSGKVLIPCAYHDIYKLRNGTAILETDEGKMGMITTRGTLAFTNLYDQIHRPKHWNQKKNKNNYNFVVTQGVFKGMLNQEGKEVIAPKYYKLYYVINDLTLVDVTGEGKHYGYVGLNGVEYFEE